LWRQSEIGRPETTLDGESEANADSGDGLRYGTLTPRILIKGGIWFQMDRFKGTHSYILSDALREIVNAAIVLQRPLLLKGEPGTGKTELAQVIAEDLDLRLIRWNIKSTSKATDGLYVYDTVQRLNDSRFHDKNVSDIRQYIKLGKLGEALRSEEQVVLLIDEIDKADLEFPNDLLFELDQMSFDVVETGDHYKAKHRPIVVITSNSEKELPDAFLRRCLFHYIDFPDPSMMERIAKVHFPNLRHNLLSQIVARFYFIRQRHELKKRPSTSELLDWIQALLAGGITEDELKKRIPFIGVLLKTEDDVAKVAVH
jgi:MoxR-like ATPase